MKRKIINIDEQKCNGCRLCVEACHEGAIEMVNGKAKLVSDQYCDGLGDCLPECPTGAISIIEREADPFDEEAVKQRMQDMKNQTKRQNTPCSCPGTAAKKITRNTKEQTKAKDIQKQELDSQLGNWPVQLSLVPQRAIYLDGADLLIAADCTAYAYADFHQEFMKDKITLIGCPKLDDNDYYAQKLEEIFTGNNIRSITVVRMEVPCCTGIVNSVKKAILASKKIVPYNEITVGIDGTIK